MINAFICPLVLSSEEYGVTGVRSFVGLKDIEMKFISNLFTRRATLKCRQCSRSSSCNTAPPIGGDNHLIMQMSQAMPAEAIAERFRLQEP